MSNWHDQRYTAHHHDHERDYRKHEARPGDRGFSPPAENEPPTRMAVECSGALEIAILAQSVSLTKAAELIDGYARSEASAARLERSLDAEDRKRMLTVSYLTAFLDTLLRIGAIPEDVRPGIRGSVDKTRAAFGLPSLDPVEVANA